MPTIRPVTTRQFVDGSGHLFRTGGAVFVQMAYEWVIAGKMRAGKAPSRTHRLFHFDDDDTDTADQRLMIESSWCWNWESLAEVPGADDLDPGLVAEMRADPRKYLEGNLVTCDEFEGVVSDASAYRTGDVEKIHAEDADAFVRIGTVNFEIWAGVDSLTLLMTTAGHREAARYNRLLRPSLARPDAREQRQLHPLDST